MAAKLEEAILALKAEIEDRRERIASQQREVETLIGALAILEYQQPQPESPLVAALRDAGKQIPWSSIISDLYTRADGMGLGQVCERLVADGVIDEIDANKRASISSTLSRKVSQGELFKKEDGTYWRNVQKAEGAESATDSDSL